jgi:hypothetical protein
MLLLKEILHCDPESKFAVHDPGFTGDIIAKNRRVLVTGRNLQERELGVIHNYKFALKYCKEFSDSGQNNPSGCKLEEMLLYVQQKMYVAFKGCRNLPSGKQALNKTSVSEWNVYAASTDT